jgi:hypothetical protein
VNFIVVSTYPGNNLSKKKKKLKNLKILNVYPNLSDINFLILYYSFYYNFLQITSAIKVNKKKLIIIIKMIVPLRKTFTSKHFSKKKKKTESTSETALTNGTFMFYFGSVRGTDSEGLGDWVEEGK